MLKHITILLPFLVSLFWTIHFFFNRKINTRSQNIWTVVMGLISTTMVVSAFYWYVDGDYSLFYKLEIIETFSTLLFIPVIFLYFRELTGDKSRSVLKISLFFIPAILFSVISAVGYLLVGDEHATYFMKGIIENNGDISIDHIPYHQIRFLINEYTYSILLLLQAIAVFIYAIHRLLLYRRHLYDFFSDVDDKDMKHHWAVLWGVLAFLILTFIVAGSGYMLYIKYDGMVSVITLLYASILYYICHHVSCSYYTSEQLVEELSLSDNIVMEEEDQSPDEEKSKTYLKFLPKFNQVIDEDKVFLQKNLRVDDVASLVGTNRTYISRILKDEYNCNFWEFMNRKRIEYAKEQVRQNPELTVDELAAMCGFSEASAFCRTFRQYEEVTFKEWQKSSLK